MKADHKTAMDCISMIHLAPTRGAVRNLAACYLELRELLQMSLLTLEHHTAQTRPVTSTNITIAALRAILEETP